MDYNSVEKFHIVNAIDKQLVGKTIWLANACLSFPTTGLRRRFQSEVRNQTPDRRPLSSPSLRPTSTSDGCVFFVSLYDYDPATMSPNPGAVDDELPFKEGDIIKVWALKSISISFAHPELVTCSIISF